MLKGRQFTVFTDHKPLTTAILSSTELTPRQFCHLDFIAQFTTDIQHIKRFENVVADALSRFNNVAAVETSSPIWSMQELADEQKKDDELKTLTSSAGRAGRVGARCPHHLRHHSLGHSTIRPADLATPAV